MLMEARKEESEEPMGNQQPRDEVMTSYLAGHETTANALP
jgi:cytochrome P450